MKDGMGELAASSNQIMESLKLIIDTTSSVKESSFKMNEEITKITGGLDNLKNISNETNSGMEEIEIGIKEIFTGAVQVSKSGTENAENINELEKLIEQFKTD